MSSLIKCPHCNKEFNNEPLEEVLNPTVNIIKHSTERSSWHDIADMIHAGEYYRMFDVGDSISCTLKDGKRIDIDVAAVNPFGDNQIAFCFHDCLDDDASMNRTNTNRGGFCESKMQDYLNDNIFNLLPDDLKEVITARKIVQTIGGTEFSAECKLWLPSLYEVCGEKYARHSCESNEKQLELFQNPRNRVKFRRGASGEDYSLHWWLRSPYVGYSANFWNVGSYGTCGNSGNASNAYGVCPCFLI